MVMVYIGDRQQLKSNEKKSMKKRSRELGENQSRKCYFKCGY